MYEATSSVQAGSREIDWAESSHHKKAKAQEPLHIELLLSGESQKYVLQRRTILGFKDHRTRTKILTNVPIGGAIRFAFTEYVLAMADGLGLNAATERVSISQPVTTCCDVTHPAGAVANFAVRCPGHHGS
ncbi:hypothetical protein [Cryobacterium sp. Hh38]|uniref:hypothetical protein n=1 Tax=Cryobacterium sp. Hh38 TaxID=1259156 RepID=UPI00106CA273|nr:hypothetical protein [Cryobacterium sp. Hh38]TFD60092.1 hypothetical protein E3T41_10270 [Cryobacterium sp. Hh38]